MTSWFQDHVTLKKHYNFLSAWALVIIIEQNDHKETLNKIMWLEKLSKRYGHYIQRVVQTNLRNIDDIILVKSHDFDNTLKFPFNSSYGLKMWTAGVVKNIK